MQVEFNWFIVAKKKEDIQNIKGCTFELEKEGQRIYPVGEQYSLPVIVEGQCLGLASITNLSLNIRATTVQFEMIQVFNEEDPLARYYEESFAAYKAQEEEADQGGRVNLTPQFLERLRRSK